MQHPEMEPEWITERGVFALQCRNPKCQEAVVLIADGSVEEYWDEQIPSEYHKGRQYAAFFTPRMFHPPLRYFTIPGDVPLPVSELIDESFSLAWSHQNASGNAIRRSVETLMSEFKIAKTVLNKRGKRQPSDLHARIEKFKAKNAECAELLLAIKWLGNAGSHGGKELKKSDLVDAYEIYEKVLNILYDSKAKSIVQKAKAINKRKGPKK